ncbi:4'-phosphopantetheinyl transferase sfp [Streptomyces sp. YIM 130001]|uniref:4'-phosphopantetheinyl transferase family protein n=1 Tax=Streptomyces sp. YIM 130001 TaxID=2259644 RepID=UPI000E652E0A|nr:4'-phosphopantetheinyl transferase superfamily protein [Streptomyces sp. YIM 130001]RII17627.1 4'-phosphopantetheinyl transferase sfp [Streptomyces sp. YIM 130001]
MTATRHQPSPRNQGAPEAAQSAAPAQDGTPWRVCPGRHADGDATPGDGGTPELWLVRVGHPADEDLAVLDTAERERATAMRRPQDRDLYITAHTALRRVLGRRLDTAPAELAFVREPCPHCDGPHGRPALSGVPVHFSLSHAGRHALIAVSDRPVGVDIELVPEPALVTDVARALHPSERDQLAMLGPESAPDAFARCWARKEAVLKGTGEGLGGGGVATLLVGTGGEPHPVPGWTLADIPEVPAGYAAAYAVRD